MYNLLAILQTIIQSYSHLPINDLFQNHLSVGIFLLNNNQVVKDLLKYHLQDINKAKSQLFLKGGNSTQRSSRQFGTKNQVQKSITQKHAFIYLAINHTKFLSLHKHLLFAKTKNQLTKIGKNFIQSLICITTQNQIIDNILSIQEKFAKEISQKCIKGFIFRISLQQRGTQDVTDQISLFLSINQFFHSHVSLVLSVHQVNEYEHLQSLISLSEKTFEEDDDEMLSMSIYCRIFQALPFKLTYDDIASLAQIETQYWGQTVCIDQGTDGVLFWFLFNHYPILLDERINQDSHTFLKPFKTSISQKNLAEKYGLKLCQEQYGHIVFKSKGLTKESLQNLALKIVIINIKRSEYCLNVDKIFGSIFQRQIKKFNQNRVKQREFQLCQKIDNEIDRLSQLLAQIQQNPHVTDSKQFIQKRKQIETQQLSYNIKRWLFIQGKQ